MRRRRPCALTTDAHSLAPQRSPRGLWLSAAQPSGKLRDPWTVETEPLKAEYDRRVEAARRYYKNVHRYGPTSAVTIRNDLMIARIKTVLMERDRIEIDELPF